VAKILRAAGHDVYTPTLTGMGEREHLLSPAVNLDLHIRDIVNVLEFENLHDVILVGHSYTGMVITGVADRALERVGQLVYLDATQPRNGQSQADVLPASMAMAESEAQEINGMLMALLPSSQLAAGVRADLVGEYEWMQSRVRPIPFACYTQKLLLENEEAVLRIPRTSVNCTVTLKAWPPDQMYRTTHADNVWEIDTSHGLMITAPEQTAEMLLRLG
jgi:pimeloyl-ACP methyl ester carboxylesterase